MNPSTLVGGGAVRMSIGLLMVVLAGGVAAHAQTANAPSSGQSMSGVVKAVSASSLTVERDAVAVVFIVNSSTRLVSRGPARGPGYYPNGANDLVLRPPRTLKDLVKIGERVTVMLRQSGSALRALEVRVVSTP